MMPWRMSSQAIAQFPFPVEPAHFEMTGVELEANRLATRSKHA
ncbi:hypothetical protein RISK_000312 [Rhodopirellula islandica]|uniref:Uncharacterized protein n=1 Tax=Rhodopirellula islandica TaxID=595434 RepID=A0A0J1BMC9_RHOIS|nr:hypothetical protein RISK_000312 [Rhodopirellula islandica]